MLIPKRVKTVNPAWIMAWKAAHNNNVYPPNSFTLLYNTPDEFIGDNGVPERVICSL